jgi:hypothetical protein
MYVYGPILQWPNRGIAQGVKGDWEPLGGSMRNRDSPTESLMSVRSSNDQAPLPSMALCQYRLTLIPESVLLTKYEILPLAIPMELAEEFGWWSDSQPPTGFEQHVSLILPEAESWCTSMRMWGHEESDDAHIVYSDDGKDKVEEIRFRLDAKKTSPELVRQICLLARELRCVLMTAEYEILAPDEAMVLAAFNHSTAKRFVDDPASTLLGLDHQKLQDRADYLMRDWKKDPPK